jgi:molecular chaperone GrpE
MTNNDNQQEVNTENIEELAKQAAAAIDAESPQGGLTPEEEIKDLTDKYLRALADNQNLRARASKDLEDARKYSMTGFAQDLIEVMENLHRAKTSIPEEKREDDATKSILEGVEMTLNALESAFKKHGIERISPNQGDDFDYNFHQAVVQVPTEEVAEGKIYNIVQAGYVLKDRILRPAIVAVAKKAEVKSGT